MTLNDALASSPTGIAVKRHNRTFMMAAVRGQRAFLYTARSIAPVSWPKVTNDWSMLNPGPTADRLLAEIK